MSIMLQNNTNEYPPDAVECPHCHHIQDMSESHQLINYWDNGETQEMECQNYDDCGKSFLIEERVRRTYYVAKSLEAA